MWPFKPDVKVKCHSNEELANLLSWYRLQLGLYGVSVRSFEVTVEIRNIFDELENGNGVVGFEVSIPYRHFKELKKKHIQQEAFDPVLEQRAISEILGRDL